MTTLDVHLEGTVHFGPILYTDYEIVKSKHTDDKRPLKRAWSGLRNPL